MDREIFIHQVLEEQQDMTAVEQFAFKKDFRQLPEDSSRYTELIPKKTPGPGQQYAFEVNLDQCTGCKSCVTACHNENGLEEDETWRSVGLLHGTGTDGPAIQHVTSACHHCLEPACLHGCPVNAYEKDPVTGVVRHLDDQCIGCQYCILKCPYDVPKYNKKKGIVHKCDMCISRLKVNEAPACVRACPNEAIRITLVEVAAVRKDPAAFVHNIPQAPDSSYTLPTTRYLTTRELPADMTSLDAAVFEPQNPHMPLVVMLVLTQLSVGVFAAQWLLQGLLHGQRTFGHIWTSLGVGAVALAASLFHLGRPLYAFRAVLGFKTSWLSREIIAFAVFTSAVFLYAWACWAKMDLAAAILGNMVFLLGGTAVLCSAMVYRDTRRTFWDTPWTIAKFFMTTLLLGSIGTLLISRGGHIFLYPALIVLSVLKMGVEFGPLADLRRREWTDMKKTAELMFGPLKCWSAARFVCGILGGVVLPAGTMAMTALISPAGMMAAAIAAGTLLLAGEILERYLFFRAVVPLRMPK